MATNIDLEKKQYQKFILWVIFSYLFFIVIILFINNYIVALTNQIQDKNSQIQAIKNRENNINQLQDKYYQIVDNINVVLTALPNDESIADFVKYLEELSNQKGVNIEILFDDKINKDVVKNKFLAFNLNVSGSGSKVKEYWQSLENGKYFINISNFDFSSTNGLDSDTKLSLVAKVYTNDPYQSSK